MGSTTVEVVKVLAPLALQQLANAAANLESGEDFAAAKTPRRSVRLVESPADLGDTMFNDTSEYVTNRFSTNYGYFYSGSASVPANGGIVVAGAQNIICWDPSKNEESDIQKFVSDQLQGTFPAGITIQVAQNLSNIFKERFTAVDLGWTPLDKRYVLPFSESGTNQILFIDMEMVTSAGYDPNNNPIGVATYVYVAYTPKPTATSAAATRKR